MMWKSYYNTVLFGNEMQHILSDTLRHIVDSSIFIDLDCQVIGPKDITILAGVAASAVDHAVKKEMRSF
jgi:hypothetical protein